MAAQAVDSHVPDDVPYFEACLPVEENCPRGRETAALRSDEADGIDDPRTGRRPYAAVQLSPGKSARRQLQSGWAFRII